MKKHILNLRTLLTTFGAAVFAFSIPAAFEWGIGPAIISAGAGFGLVIYGQTRPRQRGGHRWH